MLGNRFPENRPFSSHDGARVPPEIGKGGKPSGSKWGNLFRKKRQPYIGVTRGSRSLRRPDFGTSNFWFSEMRYVLPDMGLRRSPWYGCWRDSQSAEVAQYLPVLSGLRFFRVIIGIILTCQILRIVPFVKWLSFISHLVLPFHLYRKSTINIGIS